MHTENGSVAFYERKGKKKSTKKKKRKSTYNSQYSLVVTDLTTNWPLPGLSMGERTGPRAFQELWSYVLSFLVGMGYMGIVETSVLL